MFQSTRPHGARLKTPAQHLDEMRFNPRARMGRDRYRYLLYYLTRCFNPRARMGRDNEFSRVRP